MAFLTQDLRYACRSLRSNPGFAVAAIVTIGLGIGINTGVFSLVNAVAFADLPAAEPGQLVSIGQDVEGVQRARNNYSPFTRPEFEAYRERSETLSGVLAYGRLWSATLGGESPRSVIATPVSCNFFDVLGLGPALGGAFSGAHCDNPADAAVAILTHDFWMDRFGGNRSILDRFVTLNGVDYRVIGVAPEGFDGIDIDRPSLFVPIAARELLRPDRDIFDEDTLSWLNVVGRLAPGFSPEQVEAELRFVARQFDLEQPGRSTAVSVGRATRLSAAEMRTVVLGVSAIVMTAFGLVLLVACMNVANLMLARANVRVRDTAIRQSLGATRGRLVRQFVIESMPISIAGGFVGAVLAVWAMDIAVAAVFSALPTEASVMLQVEPKPDFRVFGFALGLSTLAGIGFGLVPALAATRHDLRSVMSQDASRGLQGRGRLQGALVGVQVAFSMILVVATALLLRGFYQTLTVEPEFDNESLIVAGAALDEFGYEPEEAVSFQRRALESIRGLAGIDDVAQVLITPLEGPSRSFTWRLPEESNAESRTLNVNSISANYFSVTGIGLVRGRAFTDAEVGAEQASVAILTESTARSFWPTEDPIGKTLVSGFGTSVRIVGIARDIQATGIGDTEALYVYMPAVAAAQPELQFVIRSERPADLVIDEINAIYQRLDPRLPARVRPLEENFALWTSVAGLAASLALGVGLLALSLASIGIFGVMATVVGRRVREIGIRLALGAGKTDVLRLMLKKSMRPVVLGAVCGVFACFGVGRLLSFLLFGVGPFDPVALAGSLTAVLGTGFLASAIPARRAMNVDPMTTLRYE